MDEQQKIDQPEQEDIHVPRPRWQVWGARIALVLFIALIIMSYVNIAQGGL